MKLFSRYTNTHELVFILFSEDHNKVFYITIQIGIQYSSYLSAIYSSDFIFDLIFFFVE